MVNSFEICVNIFEEIVTITFLMLYFGNKYSDIRKYIGFAATVVVSSAATTAFNLMYSYEGFLAFIYIFIYSVYSGIFLKGNIYNKIFVCGFINCIVYFIGFFSVVFTAAVSNINIMRYALPMQTRTVGIILSKLLHIAACAILLKYRFNNILKRGNMVMLIAMPVVTLVSIIGMTTAFLSNNELKDELLLAAGGTMLANILIYYIFIKINNDAERERVLAAYRQKEECDRKYAEEIDELYTKTCCIRHDLLNHFATIRGLLENDEDKAAKYIETVMKEQLTHMRRFVKTDNEYFNSIANAKLAICDKSEIKTNIRVMNGVLDRLNGAEIASLFGNLFDNAIEAAKNSKGKRIDLDIQLQDGRLSIFMRNTADESVLKNNRELKTNKRDKSLHGFGTKSIASIVRNRDGYIGFFEENGYFCCEILL